MTAATAGRVGDLMGRPFRRALREFRGMNRDRRDPVGSFSAEPDAVADDHDHERHQRRARPRTRSPSPSTSGSSPGSRCFGGSPSLAIVRPTRPAGCVVPVLFVRPPRLEATFAVRPVELQAHRSPGSSRRGSWIASASSPSAMVRRHRHRAVGTVVGPAAGSAIPALQAVLPQQHLLGEGDLADENRAPTDSPRWIRLIASPISGATVRTRIFGSRLIAGSGTAVGDDDLAQVRVADPLDGGVASARRAWRTRRSR